MSLSQKIWILQSDHKHEPSQKYMFGCHLEFFVSSQFIQYFWIFTECPITFPWNMFSSPTPIQSPMVHNWHADEHNMIYHTTLYHVCSRKIEVLFQAYYRVRTFSLFLVVANKDVKLHSITLSWKKDVRVSWESNPQSLRWESGVLSTRLLKILNSGKVTFGQYKF